MDSLPLSATRALSFFTAEGSEKLPRASIALYWTKTEASLSRAVNISGSVPFLPIAHGSVRVFDFPRVQISLLAACILLVALFASVSFVFIIVGKPSEFLYFQF